MKEFNITTTCIEEEHYMVDISKNIEKIKQLIEKGKYFTINRARQYGKTTTMMRLFQILQDKYIVIAGSLEGWGSEIYKSESKFAMTFLDMIRREIILQDVALAEYIDNINKVETFYELSDKITDICKKSAKEIVLMIDEVDKASSNIVFLDFLAVLRDKYNARKKNRETEKTFKSVILVGVHDIKNLKVHIKERRLLTEDEAKLIDKTTYNSPWNVAEDFIIEMSFDPEEIATMLIEYEEDYKTGMNVEDISQEIYDYTSGYPYLVSKICKVIDERLDRSWSKLGVQDAVKIILNEKGTLFDDLIKNIQNNEKLYGTIYDMLIEGKEKSYNAYTYEKGIMYGIFKQGDNGKLKVHNKIFEKLIYEYMIAEETEKKEVLTYDYRTNFIDKSGDLKLEVILEKFQLLMKQEYRKKDEKFYEKQARLLFLCFIRPIINGTGFYYVEPQTRQDNRMDVVITYNKKQYIIELKIWHGKSQEEKGLEQVVRYLDSQNEDKGYLVLFSFNKKKEYTREWIEIKEKWIFEVVV
ncbi:MAG TPA: AAA family ATPase [Clostridiales bacterium]|nr:AAA family ATPase [Clostridiales bacterium]